MKSEIFLFVLLVMMGRQCMKYYHVKTHFVFLECHWVTLRNVAFLCNYISVIRWHARLFLLPGFIGQKGMIIRIKRPVIGIYIQAHYPVSFGKYLTSSKQRKIQFSLCNDLVCVINYGTFLAIKHKILPGPWSNKTNVTCTWMCDLVD